MRCHTIRFLSFVEPYVKNTQKGGDSRSISKVGRQDYRIHEILLIFLCSCAFLWLN